MANNTLQPTAKKLRFLPSAELSRWASGNEVMRIHHKALAFAAFALGSTCFAAAPTTVFYYDKNNLPVVRVDRLKPLPESTRAILALYALQNGAGCEGRDSRGLQCTLTRALGFQSQCSTEHVALVRKWFPHSIPELNTRGTPKELQNPSAEGTLVGLCYQQPDTASWKNIWEVIRISFSGELVTVQALGQWVSTNGEGKFGYVTEFRVGGNSIEVVSNQKVRGQ